MRVIAFYDAGQVQDIGQSLKWSESIVKVTTSPQLAPYLTDLFGTVYVFPVVSEPVEVTRTTVGKTSAFKTSTGLEVRFFMPVLNVPFRLISAYNPQRYGILDNNLQLQQRFTFRFAVGTTF